MIGLVLAAGWGSRLGELTAQLPKTLLEVRNGQSILDSTLANLRGAGIEEVAVVTGYAAERIEERVPALEERHGLKVRLIFNEKALEWNNCYSLWVARELFEQGVLLVNGDTVHPPVVEERVLAARGPQLLLATDTEKTLGEEEMKVVLSADGRLERITKLMPAQTAHGEYIGVTVIEPSVAGPLADALETTWKRDPGLYYEDGFQELVDRGGEVRTAPIGKVDWVEVDSPDDYARARAIAATWPA